MDPIVQQFLSLMSIADDNPGHVSTPSRLAAAAASALESDGAVISLLSEPSMQMPIGFSGPGAAVAEQLQFTIGSGPALDAHRLGLPLLANPSMTSLCWPLFHERLAELTRFRAAASLPLRHGPARVGVLDLYFFQPFDAAAFPIDAAAHIGDVLMDRLFVDRYLTDVNELGPAWLINHAAEPRGLVSLAMGAVCMSLRLRADEALDRIRAHAAEAQLTVDETARQLIRGVLTPPQLRVAPAVRPAIR